MLQQWRNQAVFHCGQFATGLLTHPLGNTCHQPGRSTRTCSGTAETVVEGGPGVPRKRLVPVPERLQSCISLYDCCQPWNTHYTLPEIISTYTHAFYYIMNNTTDFLASSKQFKTFVPSQQHIHRIVCF